MSFVAASWSQPVLTAEFTGTGVTRMLEAMRVNLPTTASPMTSTPARASCSTTTTAHPQAGAQTPGEYHGLHRAGRLAPLTPVSSRSRRALITGITGQDEFRAASYSAPVEINGGTGDSLKPYRSGGRSFRVLRRAYHRIPKGVRRALWRRAPDAVWTKLHGRIGYVLAPLDAAPLSRIASEPLDRLRDPQHLTHNLLPSLGLTAHAAGEPLFPAYLHPRVGRGVQSIQFPNQFGPFLAEMAQAGVRSYLELGVAEGGTFAITVEVLRRFGLQRALAVDLEVPPILEQWSRPEVTFAQVDSRSSAFEDLVREHAPIDLAFVDGDHSEEAVRSDFDVLRPHARMLAFHDISQERGHPDVGRVWRSIKKEHSDKYDFREFVAQYSRTWPDPQFGIGLASRRDPSG